MASASEIQDEILNVVNKFGWDANLLNGFWVKLDDIKPKTPLSFDKEKAIYCNSASLPSISIEYEDVPISINKFKAPVPMSKTKGDLVLEITGGSVDYIKNIKQLFSSNSNESGGLDITSMFSITVYVYQANYEAVESIKYLNCYLKEIGQVTYEQSATNSFFKCPYTFRVGRIE